MPYDIVIRQARLRSGAVTDIAIAGGKYAAVAPSIGEKGKLEIAAEGRLTTESFVIAQLHLDKVLTGDWIDAGAKTEYFEESMAGAMTAIEKAAAVKARYEEGDILARIDTALGYAMFNGVSHIRAFIDVDSKAQLKAIKAAIRARDKWRGRVDLQVIAFPQDGLIREPGTEELLHECMALGADMVGGIPWIEFTDEDMRRHVDIAMDIAVKHDKDVSMLVDDAGDPGLRTTEYLALKTVQCGWTGRVAACHARAMQLYNEVYHRKVVVLLKRAGIGIVTNPHTGPLHVRVRELARDGVTLALGGESVNDPYYPYGRNNMLESAFAASHTLWAMAPADWSLLFDMITVNPAKIMRLPPHAIAAGNDANLVVLEAQSMREALAWHPEPRWYIRDGRLLTESSVVRKEH